MSQLPFGRVEAGNMVTTRSKSKAQLRSITEHFPEELWIEVLSHLGGKDIGRAVCSTQVLANVRESVWRAACERRWPVWSQVAASADTHWKRQYELLELREKELEAVPCVQAINKLQTEVNPRHRMVLTEWLAEVSWDWQLESTILFKAVNYLDQYLSQHAVTPLSDFQLVGIACLRAAMGDTVRRLPVKLTDQDVNLDPQRFAYISDRTYTPERVELMTKVVADNTEEHVKDAPNAKMFLRSLWYRAIMSTLLSADEMHIYTVASFLLQLSLLDLQCAAYSPSMVAAASLSNAFELFNKESWPEMLQRYSAYKTKEVQSCKERLKEVQATVPAEHLRVIWFTQHEKHGYEEYNDAWAKALQSIQSPTRI